MRTRHLNLSCGQVHRSCPIPPTSALLACGIPLISLKESQNKVRIVRRLYVDVKLTFGSPIASVAFCRNCERFLSPPNSWTLARPESSELLAICLKKLKGLAKVRLTDARFIWTEPHSKRLKVAMTIQKEVCRLPYPTATAC